MKYLRENQGQNVQIQLPGRLSYEEQPHIIIDKMNRMNAYDQCNSQCPTPAQSRIGSRNYCVLQFRSG